MRKLLSFSNKLNGKLTSLVYPSKVSSHWVVYHLVLIMIYKKISQTTPSHQLYSKMDCTNYDSELWWVLTEIDFYLDLSSKTLDGAKLLNIIKTLCNWMKTCKRYFNT